MKSPVRFLGVGALLFGACLMGGLGLLYLLNPDAIRNAADVSPGSASALAEIRSTYGGLHVGIGLFLLSCAAREGARRVGLLFCGLAFAGAGLARLAGIVEFQPADSGQAATAGLEVAFSVITLFLYRMWPGAHAAAPSGPHS